jgi:FHS family L-fucose permease-like MFS transporter
MVVAWTYAIAVNFVPAYTNTVDKIGESEVGLEGQGLQLELARDPRETKADKE